MTIFRALGVAVSPRGTPPPTVLTSAIPSVKRSARVDAAESATSMVSVTVRFVEVSDERQRPLFEQTFDVDDGADLRTQVGAVLADLARRHQEAQKAVNVVGQVIAEVEA